VVQFDVILQKFENAIPSKGLAELECHITKGPWLFGLGTDGVATEIEGKILRPGHSYIVLFQDNAIPNEDPSSTCFVDCENIYGKFLTLDEFTLSKDIEKYRDFGFNIFRTIRIWPAGLPARFWDGEGRCEWLTTDQPCFGFIHDYEIREFTLELGDFSLNLNGKLPGKPYFIKLPQLPVGMHVLTIKPKVDIDSISTLEGTIILEVRDPAIWTPGTMLQNGFYAMLDPNDDDLDNFLSGKTELKVVGPKSKNLSIKFNFWAGNCLIGSLITPILSFPPNSKDLKELCIIALKDEKLANARKMVIDVQGHELGEINIILWRNANPLRWYSKTNKNITYIRLIDETESNDPLTVSVYGYERPEFHKDISSEPYTEKSVASDLHGLIVARKMQYQQGIVISRTHGPVKLSDLSIKPILSNGHPQSILQYIKLIKLWYDGQCINFISNLYQQKVIDAFIHKLYSYFCDLNWANAESRYNGLTLEKGTFFLVKLIDNCNVVNLIEDRISNLNLDKLEITHEIDWLTEIFISNKICIDKELIRFAQKLTSNPFQFIDNNESLFEGEVKKLIQNQILIRITRFFVLSISKLIDPYKNYSLLLPTGWT
jgi:hypothetical protein